MKIKMLKVLLVSGLLAAAAGYTLPSLADDASGNQAVGSQPDSNVGSMDNNGASSDNNNGSSDNNNSSDNNGSSDNVGGEPDTATGDDDY